MNEYDQNEIASLTRQVENGDGCALRDFLRDIPLSDHLQILRQMDASHTQQRRLDANLPRLDIYGGMGDYGVTIQRPQDPRPTVIYQENIQSSIPTTRPDGTVATRTTIREECRTPSRLP